MTLAPLLALLLGADPAPAPAPAPAEVPSAADLHVHPVMFRSARPVFRGYPGGAGGYSQRALSPDNMLDNQLDPDELAQANMRVLLASVWPPPAISPRVTALDQAVRQLHDLHRWVQHQPKFALAHSPEEARKALAAGRVVLIPAVEGAEGIRGPEDVDALYAAGARCIQLAHFADSDVAGAALGQLSRNVLGTRDAGRNTLGLTELGKRAVKRMVEKGIIIDLAHASDQTIADVLELTKAQQVPLLFSHGGARGLSGGERNVSDEAAKAVAARGGLVGITVYRTFVAGVPADHQWPGFVEQTCDEVVAHWKYLADLVGADALALGSDFNGFVRRSKPGGSCPEGIRGSQDLPALYQALEAHGVPHQALFHAGYRLIDIWAKDIAISQGGAPAGEKP